MRERTAVSKRRGRIAFTDAESLAVNLADLRVPNALPKKSKSGFMRRRGTPFALNQTVTHFLFPIAGTTLSIKVHAQKNC
jgi:hypothetical protein